MKVLVAGTFDILHPGHIYLLEEASKLGDVYVIIARDRNVEKLKGSLPVFNEEERKVMVESIRYVKKAVLGDTGNFFRPVLEIGPDIILLGPDQNERWVKTELELNGMKARIVRIDRKRGEYSSTQTKKKLGIFTRNDCRKE
jgi:FAD synthetase